MAHVSSVTQRVLALIDQEIQVARDGGVKIVVR